MSNKPEALRLADSLERMSLSTKWDKQAAAELRRLHEVNQELLEALNHAREGIKQMTAWELPDDKSHPWTDCLKQIDAAIAKAQGENK